MSRGWETWDSLTFPLSARVEGSMWSISWSKSSRTRKKAAVSIIDIDERFIPREKNRLRTSYLGIHEQNTPNSAHRDFGYIVFFVIFRL